MRNLAISCNELLDLIAAFGIVAPGVDETEDLDEVYGSEGLAVVPAHEEAEDARLSSRQWTSPERS